MGRNPLIEALKIIALPFVFFGMLWIKVYSLFAYMITAFAHWLTFGRFPVTRNPVLVLIAIPLIQILIIPSLIIMLIYGAPKEQALANTIKSKISRDNAKIEGIILQ